MKVALTTSGNDLEAAFDERFGRAPKFIVCDTESGEFEVIENSENQNASQGAGINSATIVSNLGVEAVITGHCGPNAFRALNSAGIKVYNTDSKTVNEALEKFKSGELDAAADADVESHWS